MNDTNCTGYYYHIYNKYGQSMNWSERRPSKRFRQFAHLKHPKGKAAYKKFSDEQVKQIRWFYEQGMHTPEELAALVGGHTTYIQSIVKGRVRT